MFLKACVSAMHYVCLFVLFRVMQDKQSSKGAITQTSHIPQGDVEKADAPMTNYRDHFPGHDPRNHPIVKAPSMHHGKAVMN